VETLEWKEFIDELKKQWKTLWRDRFDDRVRAEGIANRDYPMLDVERGRIIIATRDYKPLDFAEILQKHNPPDVNGDVVPPSPSVGGWGRFIRDVLSRQKRFTKRGRPVPAEPEREEKQQRKKGGRGWLHRRL
jgi:hypothetical protein